MMKKVKNMITKMIEKLKGLDRNKKIISLTVVICLLIGGGIGISLLNKEENNDMLKVNDIVDEDEKNEADEESAEKEDDTLNEDEESENQEASENENSDSSSNSQSGASSSQNSSNSGSSTSSSGSAGSSNTGNSSSSNTGTNTGSNAGSSSNTNSNAGNTSGNGSTPSGSSGSSGNTTVTEPEPTPTPEPHVHKFVVNDTTTYYEGNDLLFNNWNEAIAKADDIHFHFGQMDYKDYAKYYYKDGKWMSSNSVFGVRCECGELWYAIELTY